MSEETNIYDETADIETASDGYAARFSGPVGEWMLEIQAAIVMGVLQDLGAKRILDVGGGHGQLAVPLAQAGFDVTVAGSSRECRNRIETFIENGQIAFTESPLLDLPYADESFDAVVCFRFISHCRHWKKLIGELCRISSGSVLIDYPTWQSVNILTPLMFRLKRFVEKNTREYTLFSHAQIEREFTCNAYRLSKRFNQFLLPMALHRAMRRVELSRSLENTFKKVQLTKLLGSPCIAVARR